MDERSVKAGESLEDSFPTARNKGMETRPASRHEQQGRTHRFLDVSSWLAS